MTNKENIQNMSTEKLVDFLNDIGIFGCRCCAYTKIEGQCCKKDCFEGINLWLKSEVANGKSMENISL